VVIKRVKFTIHDFPKFLEWTYNSEHIFWIMDFKLAGFHSAKNHRGGVMSLREEEYILFVLRWG
jgi:hypothetical protein